MHVHILSNVIKQQLMVIVNIFINFYINMHLYRSMIIVCLGVHVLWDFRVRIVRR